MAVRLKVQIIRVRLLCLELTPGRDNFRCHVIPPMFIVYQSVSEDLNSLGINQGTSGNVSVRAGNGLLVTPTGSCFGTKPPFAPTGTMTAFFTCCALASPKTSVRKSSRRSDHRRPPAVRPAVLT